MKKKTTKFSFGYKFCFKKNRHWLWQSLLSIPCLTGPNYCELREGNAPTSTYLFLSFWLPLAH